MNVLLVGHRGVGKSTIGAHLATALAMGFIDLDDLIEQSTGSSAADLVASDEPAFRHIESDAARQAVSGDGRVVAAGGGLREIPDNALVVWLDRVGWEDEARENRDRLRPDLEWQDEVTWMRDTREPRWARAAHLHYAIPAGRSAVRAAEDLADLVRWASPDAINASLRAKTWVVPAVPADLERAQWMVENLALAGIEIRSDVFSSWPEVRVPTLASVRSDDPDWLVSALERASAFDLDVGLLDVAHRAGLFDARPRPLHLSAHPASVDPEDVAALTTTAREIQTRQPAWASHVALKYAPAVASAEDIGMGRALVAPLRRAGVKLTFLPQGKRWAWVRPLLAGSNAANYVAARHRLGGDGHTPMDLQDWLPHLTGPEATKWDALVGDPVDRSRGAVWHRKAALDAGESFGYLLVPTHTDELEPILALLHELQIRGVSVTSPHKREIRWIRHDDGIGGPLLDAEAAARATTRGLPVMCGNTLARAPDGWYATDTDEVGMAASLEAIERRGVRPGTVAVFGQGGVTPAVLRAIDDSDWFVVLHVSAREGWPEQTPHYVTLVVNAAGGHGDATDGAPRSDAWLDLHYVDVAAVDAEVHLNGDTFFEAQAAAQRQFWRSATIEGG